MPSFGFRFSKPKIAAFRRHDDSRPPETREAVSASGSSGAVALISASGGSAVNVSASEPSLTPDVVVHDPVGRASVQQSSAQQTPELRGSVPPANTLQAVSERLWNVAYDKLKADQQGLVDAYERILSDRLRGPDDSAPDDKGRENVISPDRERRSEEMRHLIQNGLQRTSREASVKGKLHDGMEAILSIKDIVTSAVQASPQAAVAWVGVCLAIEVLMNPLVQASANREGIIYVVCRMDWYWNLFDLLLDRNRIDEPSQKAQAQLEKHIIDLYKSLLLYQMKSTCYYFSNRGYAFLRDLVSLDQWDIALNDIKSLEQAVRKDSKDYSSAEVLRNLDTISDNSNEQVKRLDDIASGIRDFIRQQEILQRTGEDNDLMTALCRVDPRVEKLAIEDRKGGLFADSYRWILQHRTYKEWRASRNLVLWIKADPGQGKTMLLCGIIDELENSGPDGLLVFFFCQTSDARNSATAVLRGLLYSILDQQTALITIARKVYDRAKNTAFNDQNAFYTLEGVMIQVLGALEAATIVIDALDECEKDREKLLRFIDTQSKSFPRIKWIVSSRKLPDIEARLSRVSQLQVLSLDPTAQFLRDAVNAYIQHKVRELVVDQGYDDVQEKLITQRLTSNANGTFLWVALVCRGLKEVVCWDLEGLENELNRIPTDLDDLYKRRVSQIFRLPGNVGRHILATMGIAHRPLSVSELAAADATLPQGAARLGTLERMIGQCHSFVTLNNGTVSFVHLSAKEYLLGKAYQDVFPDGKQEAHLQLVTRSLTRLSEVLRRDIYQLQDPNCALDQVKQPNPDPLAAMVYLCAYWIEHALDAGALLLDGGPVETFLKEHLLHWLEAMILLGHGSAAVGQIGVLKTHIYQSASPGLFALIYDAWRFSLWASSNFMANPLQLYYGALIFSPKSSVIRQLYYHECLCPAIRIIGLKDSWDACLQTLEGNDSRINSLAFSPDGSQIAAKTWRPDVLVWDTQTGACQPPFVQRFLDEDTVLALLSDGLKAAAASSDGTIRILNIQSRSCQDLEGSPISGEVRCLSFLQDGSKVAAGTDNGNILVWNTETGTRELLLENHCGHVSAVAMSRDESKMASALADTKIWVWCLQTRSCRMLGEHSRPQEVLSLEISPDGSKLVSQSTKSTRLWDIQTGACQVIGTDFCQLHPVFYNDGTKLAIACSGAGIQIWDIKAEAFQGVLGDCSDVPSAMALSPDGSRMAAGYPDKTIRIWDMQSGTCQLTLRGHIEHVTAMTFSSDGKRLASGGEEPTVYLWDLETEALQESGSANHSDKVLAIVFSADGSKIASASIDNTVRIWDAQTGTCQSTISHLETRDGFLVFAPDNRMIVSLPWAEELYSAFVWNTQTGICELQLHGHSERIWTAAFSSDGSRIVTGSGDMTVRVWTLFEKSDPLLLVGHTNIVSAVKFSPDGSKIASASLDCAVRLWDAQTSTCLFNLNGSSGMFLSVAFSPNGSELIAGTSNGTVQIWNVWTGSSRPPLEGHSGGVCRVTFSASGSKIVSVSDSDPRWEDDEALDDMIEYSAIDGILYTSPYNGWQWRVVMQRERMVRLWDARTGSCLQQIEGNDAEMSIALRSVPRFVGKPSLPRVVVEEDCVQIPPRFLQDDADAAQAFPSVHVSRDRLWIMSAKRRLIRIPLDYQGVATSTGPRLAIGTGLGNMVFVEWSTTHDENWEEGHKP